jgi:mannose-binding lectin 2
LTYFQDQSLELSLQYKVVDTWTQCFKVTADDGKGPINMPKTAYLGFSAHTGELSDNFDIMNVETKNLYSPVAGQNMGNAQGGPPNRGAPPTLKSTKKQGSSGGWGWFLFKIVLVMLVAGGGYAGYTAYRTKQRKEYRGF